MHESEREDLATCDDCGVAFAVGPDRGFAFGSGGALCSACAQQRGGEWDGVHETWIRAPDLTGLDYEYE